MHTQQNLRESHPTSIHAQDRANPISRRSELIRHFSSAAAAERFFFACGFDSSPRRGRVSLSLSCCAYACVLWRSVLVRSFSISFGLSALFVFNCSILFPPPSLNLLLFLLLLPFLRPIRHHWQFGALRSKAPTPEPPSCLTTPKTSSSSGITQ